MAQCNNVNMEQWNNGTMEQWNNGTGTMEQGKKVTKQQQINRTMEL